MTGFVYAIGDNADRVKIGWSADPYRRLDKLRSDCSTSATLLGIVPATRGQEREIHGLFAPWRLQGEWFRHEGPVATFVAMLSRPRPRPAGIKEPKHDHVIARYRVANAISQQELGAALGVSHVTISRYESGRMRMPPSMLKRVTEVTGIQPHTLRPDLALHFAEPAQ